MALAERMINFCGFDYQIFRFGRYALGASNEWMHVVIFNYILRVIVLSVTVVLYRVLPVRYGIHKADFFFIYM